MKISVGEEGDVNKTSSPPHDLNPLMDTRESPLRHCRLSSLPLMSPLTSGSFETVEWGKN